MRFVVFAVLAFAAGAGAQTAEPLHEVCGACHPTAAEDFRTHKHFSLGLDCAACHGESKAHRDASGAVEPDRVAAAHQQAELCGTCHADQAASFLASRHGELTQARQRGPSCGACHDVHRLRPTAILKRRCQNCHPNRPEACSAPPPEGPFRLDCANCHRPHEFRAAGVR